MADRFPAPAQPKQSGRAVSNDMHADPVAHLAASLVAGSKGLEEGETIVGHFPLGGTYRLIVDETGVHVVRRAPDTKTSDAGPRSLASIQAANRRFWDRPSGRK